MTNGTLVETLKLHGNPFEYYTAESEPNISDYAVRPPYLQAIVDRARNLSSFILFGDRGAGKSATRITIYNEIWEEIAKAKPTEGRSPFVVNLTDYSQLESVFNKGNLSDKNIVSLAAFTIVEQMLAWLSSLEESDRQVYVEGLDAEERALAFAVIQGFYFSVGEMDRVVSTSDTLRLLNSAWRTRSQVWIAQRWDALSKIIASLATTLSKKTIHDSVDISEPAEALLKSLTGEAPNAPRMVLNKLVEFSRAFGFSGVSVLIDKLDETPTTSNSAEATAQLIYPLLSHIQLLEVAGFSWILFLWSNVKDHLEGKHAVRLDKTAHANISWNEDQLKEMIEARIAFFSNQNLSFENLLDQKLDANDLFQSLVDISVKSPRELIKLLDVTIREHDARRDQNVPQLVDGHSLNLGQDKYALETIGSWFNDKPLQQVLRLGMIEFINKDVQSAFKIGDQGARVKIKTWQDAGLVRQSGTVTSELGGRQSYRFVVADARVERIIARKLDESVGAEFDD